MILSRYISLLAFVIMAVIMLRERGNLKRKLVNYWALFLEGMIGGIVIDSIGINLGYYYFPREPIYSLSYVVIVLPCRGVFGLIANYLWTKLGREKFLKGMVLTLPILSVFYEGSNLITQSWVYTVPFYCVALGWIPLVLAFVGCHRRRKVVKKLDSLIASCSNRNVVYGLSALRIIAVIVMFPLLLASLVKLIQHWPEIRKDATVLWDYSKAIVLMKGEMYVL